MNWVRSVLPSLWMKFSLPSENSPPPPIPERIWQGSHFMHFLALPSGQPRFLTMLPRSTMHTDKSEWIGPATKPRTARRAAAHDDDVKRVRHKNPPKRWHKRGRQEKSPQARDRRIIMHGFGTPVKRPPDSITPRFRRPMRTTSTLQKTFLPSQKRRPARQWFPTTAYRPSMRFSPHCEPFLLTVSQQRIDIVFLEIPKR